MQPQPHADRLATALGQTDGVQIGVDLGQQVDPTAVVWVEVSSRPAPLPKGTETIYRVQGLRRLPLGTSYPDVVRFLIDLLRALHDWEVARREDRHLRGARLDIDLYLDATGVGRPVVDMLAEALRQDARSARASVHPLVFTHGLQYDVGLGRLGKAYLVSRLQTLFAWQLVSIPQDDPETLAMVRELKAYTIKVDEESGEDKYGAFSVGEHDDLATALGLACLHDPRDWRAERGPVVW
jgi:hypothetical protein